MPVERGKQGAHAGRIAPNLAVIHPTVQDGLAEVRFIEAAIASSKARNVWTKVG
jgi:hypothetical protein